MKIFLVLKKIDTVIFVFSILDLVDKHKKVIDMIMVG